MCVHNHFTIIDAKRSENPKQTRTASVNTRKPPKQTSVNTRKPVYVTKRHKLCGHTNPLISCTNHSTRVEILFALHSSGKEVWARDTATQAKISVLPP